VDAAAFDALARTLHLDEVDLPLGQTIGRGTIAAPRASVPAPVGEPSTMATLPRLELTRASMPPPAATRDFVLSSRLGEGGMGLVWLARQTSLDREVAIKELRHEIASPSTARALLVEARATGALEHPNIVPVHALGVDDAGAPMLVMKRVEGASLADVIADPSHAAWTDLEARHGDRLGAILEVLTCVADALQFAHARGYVHRDVKPENVMIGHYGEVYLLDWGLALRIGALSEEERGSIAIVGTPGFMAPEMVMGRLEGITARTDVYLLGATLHAALTGSPRHLGSNLRQVLVAAMASEPFAYEPSVPAELASLCNRATAADPSDRPASAAAFREALALFVRHRGSQRLAEEAMVRLDTLRGEARASAADGVRATQDPDTAAALVECRFAFTQALRDWPTNAIAKQGLRESLRLMIEAELRRKSPEAAYELARQLDPPDAEIAARIDRVRDEVAESRRFEDAARIEERERDRRIGARLGVFIQSGLLVAILALGIAGTWSRIVSGGHPPATGLLGWSLGVLAIAIVTLLAFRDRALANRWGRQMSGLLVVVLTTIVAAAAIEVRRGGDADEAAMTTMTMLAAVLAGGGIGLDRRLGWSAIAMLAAAGVSAAFPPYSPLAASLAAMISVAAFLPESIRNAREVGRVG
jgi:serine/threonine-protein kinase